MSKKSSFKLFILFAVLLLISLACSTATNLGFDIGGDSGGLDSGLESQPTVDNRILYSDNFSSNSSGWDQVLDEDGSTDYVNDVYRIQLTKPTKIFWSTAGQSFDDVRIEVDATLVDGEWDNSYGLICRHADVENFYALLISSDGYYAIRKRLNGSDLSIISSDNGEYLFSDAIPQGTVTVRLAAECVGNTLRLYVNDILLAEVIDSDIPGGDVGLIVTTFDALTTTIDFDNYVVMKP